MIVTKTRIGSRPAGSELELEPAAEARLVQRGLAEWAEVPEEGGWHPVDAVPPAKPATKAELAAEARNIGIDPAGMTKAEIAEAIEAAR